MASPKFSCFRLSSDEAALLDEASQEEKEKEFRKPRSWSGIKRLLQRRRRRVVILALKKLGRQRKRFFTRLRASWRKQLKRLQNGQVHLRDLFGGNYLLMQGTSTPFRLDNRASLGRGLHGMPYGHEKIA